MTADTDTPADAERLRQEAERLAGPLPIDSQVVLAATGMSDAQRQQPEWLWHSMDGMGTSYGRWSRGQHAPYVRLDLALRALAAPSTGAEWHPIKTAPRDKRPILASASDGRSYLILEWRPRNGWWDGDQIIADDGLYITHWMPLPAPPGSPSQSAPSTGAGDAVRESALREFMAALEAECAAYFTMFPGSGRDIVAKVRRRLADTPAEEGRPPADAPGETST